MTDSPLMHRAQARTTQCDLIVEGIVVCRHDGPMLAIRTDGGRDQWVPAALVQIGDRIDPADLPEREDWIEAQS